MSTHMATKPAVNFLANIPLTDKQRTQLVHQWLRASPAVVNGKDTLQQGQLAREIVAAWKAQPKAALHTVYDCMLTTPATFYDEVAQCMIGHEEVAVPTPTMHEILGAALPTTVQSLPIVEPPSTITPISIPSPLIKHIPFSGDIAPNAGQQLAIDFADSGKSFVFTGPAGCGKTTGERWIVRKIYDKWVAKGSRGGHRFKNRRTGIRHLAAPIAICSFTNKAANNSAKAIHADPVLAAALPYNVTTIHNLLEFEPYWFDREDGSKGMVFRPTKDSSNPLDITHCIIEEASNVGALDLYPMLFDAMRPGTTVILVGDINQIPPIFSPSILNYGLVQLPVVELTEVYRQAADSPIIGNAHRILRGEMVVNAAPFFRVIDGKRAAKLMSEATCVHRMVRSLKKWYTERGEDGARVYDPSQDIILSPYNVGDSGTIAINAHIAQFLGGLRGAEVYEVLTGMSKQYLAVGDNIMFMKREGVITRIARNGKYIGREAQPPGTDLTRWGMRVQTKQAAAAEEAATAVGEADDLGDIVGYEAMNVDDVAEEGMTKQQASHLVHVEFDDGSTDCLETVGDFGPGSFSLGYALTVHKAQGSEWRKVFFLLHKRHATHLNREMLYTGVTRARTHCMVIDYCDQFEKSLRVQRVAGNTVEEKIALFNSKISLKEPVQVVKNW